MPEHIIAAGDIAVHGIALTANVVETVTFDRNVQRVEVISDGIASVFYTDDGSTPTINGANCRILPAGGMAVDERSMGRNVDSLRFVSTGTPTLSVQIA